ncbi:unnamed protein product [Didymodactylos carnosus]|uniref:TRPM SLOG domain-containing protein n=1 Tax=Didymodactylos carnosus TaxID=1234261 RepID=A0A815D434_9BILA|nr:unnamed protein product [Didymodactylos carnosus]CAF4092299.1 unnamed protein product [Didymodactylos carnosus]
MNPTSEQIHLNQFTHRSDLDIEDTDIESLQSNHTHFILIDNGRNAGYSADSDRSDFVKLILESKTNRCFAVTIIVEGGIHTTEVILNDLKEKRSVIIIQGSGKMADLIAKLMEITSDKTQQSTRDLTDEEIKSNIKLFLPNWFQTATVNDLNESYRSIREILKLSLRQYLHVYHLGSNASLTETIFNSVFKTHITEEIFNSVVKAPFTEKELLYLAIKWNCLENVKRTLEQKQHKTQDRELYSKVFKQAMLSDRWKVVDYILRLNFSPLETYEYIDYKEQKPNSVKITSQLLQTNVNRISDKKSTIINLNNDKNDAINNN